MLRRMTPADLLSALYAGAGIAACVCYLPQLRRLLREPAARRAMSLATWGGWLAVGAVSLAYAAVVVDSPEMVAVTAANGMCQAAVFALALAQRLADRRS